MKRSIGLNPNMINKIAQIDIILKALTEEIDKVTKNTLSDFEETVFKEKILSIGNLIKSHPEVIGDNLRNIEFKEKKLVDKLNRKKRVLKKEKIEEKIEEIEKKSDVEKNIQNQITQRPDIVSIAEDLKKYIPQFDGIPFIGVEYDEEIDNYSSISIDPDGNGVLGDTNYTPAQINKIKTAIKYFRSIPPENPIKQIINSYQSDPDAEDILNSDRTERMSRATFAGYRVSRYFNLDPSKPFFGRDLKETGLGRAAIELMNEEDVDSSFVDGYNRFFNILFEGLVHLVIMALVFSSWPSFTPPFSSEEEPRISVYVGTGKAQSGEANCLNFKLAEIENGTIQPGATILVYAPVTSASNDAKVAIQKFAKPNGSIIKINLANGKSYVCVSTGRNEAETFVLAGEYQYIRQYHFRDPFPIIEFYYNKGRLTVYEFNQLDRHFIGITSGDITQDYWNRLKTNIQSAIKSSIPELNPEIIRQKSLLRSSTKETAFYANGGIKTNKRRKSNKRRRTNKRRKSNKRKSNKRNSNKRRTKRRI